MISCPLREAAVGLLAIMSGHADRINLNPFEVYYISGTHNKCHILVGGDAQTITGSWLSRTQLADPLGILSF